MTAEQVAPSPELSALVAAFRTGATMRAAAARLGVDVGTVEAMLADATAAGLIAGGQWCMPARTADGGCLGCAPSGDATCGGCPLATQP